MGSSSSPKTQNVSRLTKGQQRLADMYGSFLSPYIGQWLEQYPGQLPGTQPIGALGQSAYGFAQQLLPQASGALSSLLGGQPLWNVNPETTEALIGRMGTEARGGFESLTKPGVLSQYVMAGHSPGYSTRAQEGLGRAAAGLEQNLATQAAGLRYADEESRRRAEAQGKEMQLRAGALAPSVTQGALGMEAAYRQLLNEPLMAQYQEYLRRHPVTSPVNQLVMQYLGMQMFDTLVQPGYQAGGLGGALAGAGAGAAGGSAFGPWGTLMGAILGGIGGSF